MPLLADDESAIEEVQGIIERQLNQLGRFVDDQLDVSRTSMVLRHEFLTNATITCNGMRSPLLIRNRRRFVVTEQVVGRRLHVFG